jgi:hypothetical protein
VSNCNCSICQKNSYLTIYPNWEDIEWLNGWDEMKNYRFGSKNRDDQFCSAYCRKHCTLDWVEMMWVTTAKLYCLRLLVRARRAFSTQSYLFDSSPFLQDISGSSVSRTVLRAAVLAIPVIAT